MIENVLKELLDESRKKRKKNHETRTKYSTQIKSPDIHGNL